MKKYSKFWALALCLVMCVNLATPALAVGETNTAGITFSLELSDSELYVSDQAQTVTATIKASDNVTIKDMQYVLTVPSGVTVAAPTYASGEGVWNSTDLKATWYASSDVTTSTLATIQLTIPANTVAGDLSFSVSGIMLSNSTNSLGEYFENGASASATLTITEGTPVVPEGQYAATISSDTSNPATVRVGDTIKVDLGSNAAFSAMHMIVTYPSNLVTFDQTTSSLGTATVNSAAAGTLDMADYGTDKIAGSSNYVLAFKAISDGTASFGLTQAKFGTGTSSETATLTDATLPSALRITIEKAQHSVTLPDIFAGATSVEDGATYTFTPETATGAYYDYELPTATMNGESVTVTATDGGWSIDDVTGDLEITGSRSAKSYTVTTNTVFGEETTPETGSATYGTDYRFTVPADVAPNTSAGYTYTLTSVTIGGTAYSDYTVEEGTRNYTIPGADIKGVIVITITKTEQPANTFNVAISGDGAGQVTANPTTVTAGNDVTLTLTPEAGYTYTITVGGTVVPLSGWTEGNDGTYTYTIENVQSANDVTVVVGKTLTTAYMTSSQYVQLDGSVMWLVKIAPTDPADTTVSAKITGKTYTYQGSNMYWSSAYNAYVTLVVAETEPTLAAADFAITSVDTIPEITYDMNVNMTDDNVVDPADAQLVWNMYKPKYSGFTENVAMMKFLKADVNGDAKIDVNDATAIINSVLKITTGTN